MRQVDVAIMGTLAIIWAGLAIALFFILRLVPGAGAGPDEVAFFDQLSWTILWGGLVLAAAYLAATIGMARSEPWGRGMVFAMSTFTMLTVIGIPVAIAQFVALTRPGIEYE